MDRVVLERAWIDSYDFPVPEIVKKRDMLISRPAERLASEVYRAAMALREEGINWYGSDFEEELLKVVQKGDSEITNAGVHISVKEYKEILDLRKSVDIKGVDEVIAAATERSVKTPNADCEKAIEH